MLICAVNYQNFLFLVIRYSKHSYIYRHYKFVEVAYFYEDCFQKLSIEILAGFMLYGHKIFLILLKISHFHFPSPTTVSSACNILGIISQTNHTARRTDFVHPQ